MSEAISLLKLEHENLGHVFDIMDDEIRRAEVGASVDASLLLLIQEYLAGYPDECHHPKEDLAFRKLRERAPERAAALMDLEREHHEIARATRCLGERLQEAVDEGHFAGGELLEELHSFVAIYRDHMVREERDFFPAVLDSLSRDDLAEIDFALFDSADNLFDRSTEARFGSLRAEIERRADQEAGVSPSGSALDRLPELASVQRFNRRMGDRGFRLTAYRAGGYALECRGRWVLDIPECSEARAAWCAAFYVAGLGEREET